MLHLLATESTADYLWFTGYGFLFFFFHFASLNFLSFCTFPITSIKYLSYQEKMVNNTEGKEILPKPKGPFQRLTSSKNSWFSNLVWFPSESSFPLFSLWNDKHYDTKKITYRYYYFFITHRSLVKQGLHRRLVSIPGAKTKTNQSKPNLFHKPILEKSEGG